MEVEKAARVPRAVTYLAGLVVVFTVAGVVRIVTLLPDGEAELMFWIAAAALLLGLVSATIVMTCAVLLKELGGRTAAEAVEGSPDPEVASWVADEPPDYVTGL